MQGGILKLHPGIPYNLLIWRLRKNGTPFSLFVCGLWVCHVFAIHMGTTAMSCPQILSAQDISRSVSITFPPH